MAGIAVPERWTGVGCGCQAFGLQILRGLVLELESQHSARRMGKRKIVDKHGSR